ncbi:Cna B-type domain-containing protein [Lactobacillus xujianguonis]|uniref:Cna B-type domain-containing protein n=1 Tax=Lactobacillus xujianguonis TaxID=2495899 RepID=UPI0011E4DC67|nr:Cna B-type domain-containing protein [Lactobacillus xujianguonis]
MKKKLWSLLLALMLINTTIVSGLNSVTVSANEINVVNQQNVTSVNSEKEQSQVSVKDGNDHVQKNSKEPLGLENNTNTDDVASKERKQEKQSTPKLQNSTKIRFYNYSGDDMAGFSPKVEVINKNNNSVIFSGIVPQFINGTAEIDTLKQIDANTALIVKIDGQAITETPEDISIEGKEYEASLNEYNNFIDVSVQQVNKPEDKFLRVKKYWYDCNFKYEMVEPSATISTVMASFVALNEENSHSISKENASTSQYYELNDGTELNINAGKVLPSSEIPVSDIRVRLYVDGQPTDQVIKLGDNNNWQGKFDISKYVDKYGNYVSKDGHYYQLTVVEEGTKGTQISFLGKSYNVLSVLGMQHDAYLFNSEAECELPLNIPVKKIWKNEKGKVEKAAADLPKMIKVSLMAGNKVVQTQELSQSNNWQYVFDNLPRYEKNTGKEIKYSLKEEAVKGYDSQITGDMKNGFVITNVKIPGEPNEPTPKVPGEPNEPTPKVPGEPNEPTPKVPGEPNEPTPKVPGEPDEPTPKVPGEPDEPTPKVPGEPNEPTPKVPGEPNEPIPKVPDEPNEPTSNVPIKQRQVTRISSKLEKATSDKKIPKTGENSNMSTYLVGTLIVMAAAFLILTNFKKHKIENKKRR